MIDSIRSAVPTTLQDTLVPVPGSTLDPNSFLGARVAGNLRRLLAVDLEPLLAPFEHRPGAHPWIGEHIGKWMHAASLACRDTADAELGEKLRVASGRLIATQEADGYLGTYEPGRRLGNEPGADWDVWTHKYCLVGLLAYHSLSGDDGAVVAATRAADLLAATFGDGPGQRSIVAGAWHMGMAPSSVLGPVVELYRVTGEARFLAFAEYILRAWDEPGGPRVRTILLESGRVSEVGNGKAYEMLSDIVGLLALAQVTGDLGHLAAARAAWDDVATHHLYVTGTASFGEHFHRPDELPDSTSVNMGETCVTVTWLQLTRQLFALTGETRYADELERTFYNHLSAAQQPDGAGWSYYTPLYGHREYDGGISCCISSGPRGMAAVPSTVLWHGPGESDVAVCLYTPCTAQLELPGGIVRIRMETGMPWTGGAVLTFTQPESVECGLLLRRPAWAEEATADGVAAETDGWIRLPSRAYRAGDTVRVDFSVGLRRVEGREWNSGRVALAQGLLVLAHQIEPQSATAFDHAPSSAPAALGPERQEAAWRLDNDLTGPVPVTVAPFATAADSQHACRVWIPAASPHHQLSAFHGAEEELSSGVPGRASFNDYDPWSYAEATGDESSWFSLSSRHPVTFSRVVFVHGRCMVHGGWFDTSAGPPEIQVQTHKDAGWHTVGVIGDYTGTDAVHSGGLAPATRFDVRLPEPVEAVGLRVVGRGAWGDYPDQRFATCALLQGF